MASRQLDTVALNALCKCLHPFSGPLPGQPRLPNPTLLDRLAPRSSQP